ARARGAAIQFVKSNLQPRDVVSVMQASTGPVRVLQDFTNDKSLLETAISSVGAPEAPSPSGSQLALLQQTAALLGALPGKKALIYFAGTRQYLEMKDEAQVKSAIQVALA